MRSVLALVMVLVLGGCYGLPPTTEAAVRDSIAANEGHMADESLPQSTHEVAQDNNDILWKVLYGAGHEDELPADVRERMDAREAADIAVVGSAE